MTSTPQNTKWPCRSMQQQHGSSCLRAVKMRASYTYVYATAKKIFKCSHQRRKIRCTARTQCAQQLTAPCRAMSGRQNELLRLQYCNCLCTAIGKPLPRTILRESKTTEKSKMIQVFLK